MKLTIFFLLLSSSVLAEEVKMGFGVFPPFVFPEGKGIEVEIISEALAFRGHKLVPVLLPFGRLVVAYKTKKVDATISDIGEKNLANDGFYGDTAVIFKNAFITLKKRHLKISKPEDLNGLNINGFVGAGARYQSWLSKVIKAGTYSEHSNQSLQVLQLMKERIDVVLSDENIFKYYFIQNKKETKYKFSDFEVHLPFEENPLNYRPIFRSKKIRDDFNLGLSYIKKNGRHQAIFDKYFKELDVANTVFSTNLALLEDVDRLLEYHEKLPLNMN
jgi:polar amino acid transport system substrate-binding protein